MSYCKYPTFRKFLVPTMVNIVNRTLLLAFQELSLTHLLISGCFARYISKFFLGWKTGTVRCCLPFSLFCSGLCQEADKTALHQ